MNFFQFSQILIFLATFITVTSHHEAFKNRKARIQPLQIQPQHPKTLQC